MEKYPIHTFSKKLLQKSVFPNLKAYLEKKDIPLAPISINLDLLTACNFQCDHCIDAEILNTGKILNLDYVKKLLADWTKRGLRSVILIGGGEPTLHPHFEEAVKFLKSLNLQVGIVSNGTRLDKIENICRFLDKKDWIRLSLDAGKDKIFQEIHHPRVKVTLEEIMAGVRKIRKENPAVQIGYSFLVIGDNKKVNKVSLLKNIGEISAAARLAKENGFSYLSLKPFIDPDGARKTTINTKNLREIKKEIKKAKAFESDNFKIVESINLLCFYDKELKKIMQRQPKTCHAQFFRSVVIPAGIYTCSLWRGFNSTKIAESNQRITKDYYRNLEQNWTKMIKTFNAKKTCREVNCLYAPLNCWIEGLTKSPKKVKELKAISDFGDYFF